MSFLWLLWAPGEMIHRWFGSIKSNQNIFHLPYFEVCALLGGVEDSWIGFVIGFLALMSFWWVLLFSEEICCSCNFAKCAFLWYIIEMPKFPFYYYESTARYKIITETRHLDYYNVMSLQATLNLKCYLSCSWFYLFYSFSVEAISKCL